MIAPTNVQRKHDLNVTRDWDLRASDNFARACRQAVWNRVLSALSGRSNRLITLDERMFGCIPGSQFDPGIQNVPLNKIKGTVGRNGDFDRGFMPRRNHLRDRWMRVDYAYRQGYPLPAIKLIQVEGEYFVADGHHRVSVARKYGQTFIDAHVVWLQTMCPVDRSGIVRFCTEAA